MKEHGKIGSNKGFKRSELILILVAIVLLGFTISKMQPNNASSDNKAKIERVKAKIEAIRAQRMNKP